MQQQFMVERRVVLRHDASGSSPSQAGALFSVLGRLAGGADASGVLRLRDGTGTRLGEIVLSRGRVCYISSRRSSPRLGEMLRERSPSSAAMVDNAITLARRRGCLLGKTLLDLGYPHIELIRSCLLEQSANALHALSREYAGNGTTVFSQLRGEFPAALSFSAWEVYLATLALCGDEVVLAVANNCAIAVFHRLAQYAKVAVLFDIGTASTSAMLGFPVAVRSTTEMSPDELEQLSATAQRIAQPVALASADVHPNLVMLGSAHDCAILVQCREYLALVGGVYDGQRGRAASEAFVIVRDWSRSGTR